MPNFDHDDITLYYETHGSGPPLLLIAGFASDSQSWQPVIRTLAERFSVIVFDNRGSGRTRPMNDFVSIGDMADDCGRLLDHLGLGASHVLGHSMGGFIAQELALRQPHRMISLILAATACRNSPRNNALFADWVDNYTNGANREQWFRAIFYWLFTPRFFDDRHNVAAAVNYAIEYPFPQSGAALANQVRSMTAFDRSGDISTITLPTLVITGSVDLLFPPETADVLVQLLPAGRLETIRNAAHSIHSEQPDAFCRAIITFLDEGSRLGATKETLSGTGHNP
jgi:pimeloyl-ACP methyl ester carboxylesterase